MSRKNFEAIASAVKLASYCENTEDLLEVLTNMLCIHFSEDNKAFNEEKFIEACGL